MPETCSEISMPTNERVGVNKKLFDFTSALEFVAQQKLVEYEQYFRIGGKYRAGLQASSEENGIALSP